MHSEIGTNRNCNAICLVAERYWDAVATLLGCGGMGD
jgi:hypothetical protein